MPTAKQVDPSGTGSIRRAYEKQFEQRVDAVRRVVRLAIVEQDALGLNPVKRTFALTPPAKRRWAGITPAKKVRAFGAWLRDIVDEGIINGQDLVGLAEAGAWQRTFIRRSYVNGVLSTQSALQRAGRDIGDQTAAQIFNSPFHRNQMESLFARNLDELEGFSNTLASQLKRTLADALLSGLNPRETARDISKNFDVSMNRARTIARTEVIRANSVAQLATFEQFGEQGIQLQAEFLTAEDDRVCPQCEPLGGKVFTIDEARGMIPVHPNCRCNFIPVQQDVLATSKLVRSSSRTSRDRQVLERELK